ncbi:hypothetical protein [Listeria innocua]|uniref:hypothetical protein n=1 Tax=Listeria innocua TaxID=1642 RepID=UPI00162966A5|nr:hypothetical protein [Listeria innocua]MBC1386152.1 hypothetical protein [Listeria innocua]MBC1407394.1 hypothetical protein [Listeria innocua]
MAFKKLIIVLTIAALFLSFNLVVDAETGSDNLAANEAVVTNFAELKAAISEDNGIDTVYLGADVELSGGIIIPASKKTFTLSGKNPATGEIHTLTETMASSGAQSSVITVNTNTGTKETTLKDINVIGKNYYGTISVYGAAKDVVQNYENVHYQGPQMIYNLNGVANFKGTNDITIASVVSGSAAVNEVAEIKGVNVSGKLNINHASGNANSAFWFGGGTADVNTFTVEENADVTVLSNGTGMFYRSGAKPIDIDVKKNAKLNITSNNNIFRDTPGGAVKIAEGADVTMTKTAGSNPLLWSADDITVSPNARLILNKTGGTGYIIQFYNATAKLDIQDPLSFLVATNSNTPMFYWPYANTFNLDVQLVNYWNTAGAIDRTDQPAQIFNLSNGQNVTGSLTYSGTTTKILSTNAGMTPTNFNQNTARMIAMGRLEGTINPVTDGESEVTGTATPNAFVNIAYTENGENKLLAGQADDTGVYRIAIPNGFIKPYTDLVTTIIQDQKRITLDPVTVKDVTPPSGDAVPQVLNIEDSLPDAHHLVTNITDHSDGTTGEGVTFTILNEPDTNVFGPTEAIVRLEDKANNYADIHVPVFIKDDLTEIQDEQALRAKDFSVNVKDLINLNDEEVKQFILDKSEAKAFNIVTGKDLTTDVKVTSTNLKKETGTYTATLQIGTLTKEITIQVTGELKFNHVPATMSFESIELNNQKSIAKRNTGFDLSVLDSRGAGSQFSVTASVKSPLTSTTNPAHTLPNGLIFIDSNGEKKPLSEEPITIYQSNATDDMIVPITWAENQGILVEADAAHAYTDEDYETIIEWTLTDAP